MEQHWERRHPLVALGAADIEQRLRAVFPAPRVVAFAPLTAGLRNTNYRVQLADRAAPVLLRLFTADAAACAREVALVRLLHGRVPVPAVLYADPAADPPWTVTSWIEGERFDVVLQAGNASDIEAAAHAAGTVLAQIHAIDFPLPGFFGTDLEIAQSLDNSGGGWAGYIGHCLFQGHAGQALGAELTQRLWRFVNDNAGRLEPLKGQSALVHADYKPWNLLVQHVAETWSVAAVLDWEFAFAGSPLFDGAIFLRQEAFLPPGYASGFVAGYRAGGGDLPADWHALVKLLDLLNMCSMLDQPEGDTGTAQDLGRLIQASIDSLSAN